MHQALHRVRKPDRLEQPHDLVIEVHRPREVVGRRLALEHERADPLQPKQVGQHRADRTKADNDDVGLSIS